MSEEFVWAITYGVFSTISLLIAKYDERDRYDRNFLVGLATVALLVSWGMIVLGVT